MDRLNIIPGDPITDTLAFRRIIRHCSIVRSAIGQITFRVAADGPGDSAGLIYRPLIYCNRLIERRAR